mmetsp:Transcript_22485/g.30088  ORF Transcript_22485/g.30088 Transcript_22485/m.30088 type:complete len:121 (+) Transcript_22485:34-396(+)
MFYGKALPAELTRETKGFIVRGAQKDYDEIAALFKALFKNVRNLEVLARNSLKDDSKQENLIPDRDEPLILFMEKLSPLTVALYRKYSRMSEEVQAIELAEVPVTRRKNFEITFNQNFKK